MVAVTENLVEFRFYRPSAAEVFVVGDFTSWRERKIRMRRTPEGYWVAKVHLPPGSFRFRYLADGHWFTDYAAFGVEHGPYGLDSVLRVAAE